VKQIVDYNIRRNKVAHSYNQMVYQQVAFYTLYKKNIFHANDDLYMKDPMKKKSYYFNPFGFFFVFTNL
jgi:hypothetical protein